MGNLYESKAMQQVKKVGEKFAGNKAIASVSAGMMMAMGIILIGAVFQLVAIIPTFFKLYSTEDAIYKILMVPYDLSMGLISIYMAFTIAYSYAKSLKMQAVTTALNSLLVFLIVAAPIKTVALADGSSFTGIDNSCLGAIGMFTAILVSLCTVKLAHFCEKHHLMIRMPDAVPKFLQDTFASLIPLIVNIAIWHTIGSLCTGLMTISLPYAISYLLSAPLGALTSVPGILIVVFVANLLWHPRHNGGLHCHYAGADGIYRNKRSVDVPGAGTCVHPCGPVRHYELLRRYRKYPGAVRYGTVL